MPTLPAHPNLDQLRHQAKDLLSAAKAGEADAVNELRRVSERVMLDAAQLAISRRYGFASWAKLRDGSSPPLLCSSPSPERNSITVLISLETIDPLFSPSCPARENAWSLSG